MGLKTTFLSGVKRRSVRLLCAILLGVLVLSLASCAASTRTLPKLQAKSPTSSAAPLSDALQVPGARTQYKIHATLDEEAMTLACQQLVNYGYDGQTPAEDLVFHLYPNAFKTETTAPFEDDEMWRAYPNGFSSGGIILYEVRIGGQQVEYSVGGVDGTVLRIPLKTPIKAGDSLVVEMEYTVVLPENHGRFGHGEHTINACNWYPIAAIREGDVWRDDPYHAVGDPFYSDIAQYEVTIDTPSRLVVATSGNLSQQAGKPGRTVWTAKAQNVRDFAFFASRGFQTLSRATAGGVTVTSYHWSQDAGERALDTAVKAIEYFSRVFGPYPYPEFRVVQSDFFIGGMEYPNIVQIGSGLYNAGREEVLELVVAHEVAHQWWYQLVGSDAIREPWLDEALTDYSAYLYFWDRYGEEVGQGIYKRYAENKYMAHAGRWMDQGEERIDLSAPEYPTNRVYDALVYGKGSIMMHALRKDIGDDAFFAALSQYFYDNIYTNATQLDLINAIKNATGRDYADWLEGWLSGKTMPAAS